MLILTLHNLREGAIHGGDLIHVVNFEGALASMGAKYYEIQEDIYTIPFDRKSLH